MILIETSTTADAKKFVEKNLELLGGLISVEHNRGKNGIDYETIINGELEEMHIRGGLTSGYQGEGTSGLISVLKMLGVQEEVAVELVEGNKDYVYSFEQQL